MVDPTIVFKIRIITALLGFWRIFFFPKFFGKVNGVLEKAMTLNIVYLHYLLHEKVMEIKEECLMSLLTDLSKNFDCLPNHLSVVKLHAVGFDNKLLPSVQ